MSKTCLILDSSLMVRRVAARIVRDLGFDVVEATTGQEALSICMRSLPDVILLDWKVGQMDGAEFVAQLKSQISGALPTILFCTADRRPERIVEALKAGADDYIMKPFDSDIIESKFAIGGLIKPRTTVA